MKFIVWIHYDTGVQLLVKAKNDEEAIEKSEQLLEEMDEKEFMRQIKHNLQQGEADVKEKQIDDVYNQSFKCIECGKKVDCDLWYLNEINKGNEEQMCEDCKDKIIHGDDNNE